jgi:preprotein translocase subunit YajC
MITPLLFLADAPAAAPQGNPFGGMLVPMTCMLVIFYFLLIRPQNKQRQELQKLISNLKTGDKVVTSSGIHGIIANVKEGSSLILKIADNVKIEIDKSAIASVVTADKDKGASDKATTSDKSTADKNPALKES